VRCWREADDGGPKQWWVGARCGASGGTERQSREWDEVRWGAAVLGVSFIGPEDGRGGGAVRGTADGGVRH
jgi:hypothetical protein